MKHKWALAWTKKNKNLGVDTTQRSESTNSALKRKLNMVTSSLDGLLKALEEMCVNNVVDNANQKHRQASSHPLNSTELLKHLSDYVTIAVDE